jgi:hypothetical protein
MALAVGGHVSEARFGRDRAQCRFGEQLGLQGATLIGNPGGECGVNLISQLGKRRAPKSAPHIPR